jgi:hypothetical protein
MFRARAPALGLENPPGATERCEWLCRMQHWGIPTRLLDWSDGLLAACYCAVMADLPKMRDDVDSAIWFLNAPLLNEIVLGDTTLFPAHHDKFRPLFDDAFGEYGGPIKRPQYAALSPIHSERRQSVQLSQFTIHTDATPLDSHPKSSDFLRWCIIPKNTKFDLVTELAMLGLRPTSVFPDLTSLALEIKATGIPGDWISPA